MDRVQFSAILNAVDDVSRISFSIDIVDNISFGTCKDSIVFTSSSKELTDKYAQFVLKHYRTLGGSPVLLCTSDVSLEEFGIYQITITVK